MTRRLVVTADDLGRDPHTTATVLDLIAESRVTATTLIPVAPGALDAGRTALELGVTPRMHATLTSERGLSPWYSLTSGLAGDGGRLPFDPGSLAGDDDAVGAELTAQLRWLRASGLHPGGVDSHSGSLYGLTGRSWLALTLRWCAERGLAFRLPRDLVPYLGGPPSPGLATRHRDAVTLADDLGVPLPATMLTNRSTAVELGSYERLRERMIEALDLLPDGVSELFLHPAEGLPGDVGTVRAWEARMLRDPAWQTAVAAIGVELVPDWWDAPR